MQQEAFQNLMDMGVKADYLIENKEAIAASVVKTLKEYPGRIKDLDPSALRSLTAIVGEAAMPVAALAKMKKAEEVAKAGHVADVAKGGHVKPEIAGSLPGPKQVELNRINGRGFQEEVHNSLRLAENKGGTTVTLPDGSKVTTIPDLLGSQTGVADIKNVVNISRTKQLQAQIQLAKDRGEPFNLVVSPRTQTLSKPLLDEIEQTGGRVFQFNASTGKFSDVITDGNRILR